MNILGMTAKENMKINQYDTNSYNDASMKVIEDSVTAFGLSLEFSYYGDDIGEYGQWYELEKLVDNTWCKIPLTDDEEMTWDSIFYEVGKNEPRTERVEWFGVYGQLTQGKYRIIKLFHDFRESEDYSKYYLSAEFIID